MFLFYGYIKLMAALLIVAAVSLAMCLSVKKLTVAATSRAAARIAGALIGSVTGTFAFQLLAVPALLLLFGVFWCLQHVIGQLDGSAQIIWNITVIFSMLGLFIFASLTGFIVGWGVGARVACGVPVARSLAGSRVFSALSARIPCTRSRVAA